MTSKPGKCMRVLLFSVDTRSRARLSTRRSNSWTSQASASLGRVH